MAAKEGPEAVLGTPREERALKLVALLSVAGIALSVYLTYLHFLVAASSGNVCTYAPGLSCDDVLGSPHAYLFGIPLAPIGLVGFVGTLALALWRFLYMDRPATMWAPVLLAGWAGLGIALGVYLTYLELAVIHAICPFCLASFIVMIGIVVVLALTYWDYGWWFLRTRLRGRAEHG